MSTKPVGPAPHDLPTIKSQESAIVLPHFTADDAFQIGTSIYHRVRILYSGAAAVISITHANNDQLLFHAATSGVSPDNDNWVARKRKTVKRFGASSWFMGRKMEGDEAKFAAKYGLDGKEYAIHGGGVPVRVRGVEGIVGVVVLSGLKQDEDHMMVVEGLEMFVAECAKTGKTV